MSNESEVQLVGGRVTEGVVRVGDTVRRPLGPHSAFVHHLLEHLEAVGFEGAPRLLGIDDKGREILSYIEGRVPPDLGWLDNEQIAAGAELLRAFHDATAGHGITEGCEVVCHGDASPCNVVFAREVPVALIDFDAAHPGNRMTDVGYAAWSWLDIGEPEYDPREVGRRLGIFAGHYQMTDPHDLVDAIVDAQKRLLRKCDLSVQGGPRGVQTANWCRACIRWTREHDEVLRYAAEMAWAEIVRERAANG